MTTMDRLQVTLEAARMALDPTGGAQSRHRRLNDAAVIVVINAISHVADRGGGSRGESAAAAEAAVSPVSDGLALELDAMTGLMTMTGKANARSRESPLLTCSVTTASDVASARPKAVTPITRGGSGGGSALDGNSNEILTLGSGCQLIAREPISGGDSGGIGGNCVIDPCIFGDTPAFPGYNSRTTSDNDRSPRLMAVLSPPACVVAEG